MGINQAYNALRHSISASYRHKGYSWDESRVLADLDINDMCNTELMEKLCQHEEED